VVAAFLAALTVSCPDALASREGEKRAPLTGNWGGDHAGMEASDRRTRLDFDCANGSIDGPITPDEQGGFDVPGTYVQEGPGPVRQEQLRGAPVRYQGKIDGDTLTLSVRPSGSDTTLGPFMLVKGRLARIRKCG
jgi:hypothetical protein